MRKGRNEWGAAALLLLLAVPAAAQSPTARSEYEEYTGRPKPAPTIPAEVRAMVAEATPDRLVVRRLNGETVSISLDYIEPVRFSTWQDGRFLGFDYAGYEAEGYDLVDRRQTVGDPVMETGQAPVFSLNGRFFAAAEMTESAFGNLNGVGLWEVLPDRTVRRLFTDALPRGFDWRVDGWMRPDCVAISAVEMGWQPPEGQDWEPAVRSAPRVNYAIEVGDGIVLSPTYDRAPCVNDEGPR